MKKIITLLCFMYLLSFMASAQITRTLIGLSLGMTEQEVKQLYPSAHKQKIHVDYDPGFVLDLGEQTFAGVQWKNVRITFGGKRVEEICFITLSHLDYMTIQFDLKDKYKKYLKEGGVLFSDGKTDIELRMYEEKYLNFAPQMQYWLIYKNHYDIKRISSPKRKGYNEL